MAELNTVGLHDNISSARVSTPPTTPPADDAFGRRTNRNPLRSATDATAVADSAYSTPASGGTLQSGSVDCEPT
eukprot:355732-Chlamydomonas_euryale.AAC.5